MSTHDLAVALGFFTYTLLVLVGFRKKLERDGVIYTQEELRRMRRR